MPKGSRDGWMWPREQGCHARGCSAHTADSRPSVTAADPLASPAAPARSVRHEYLCEQTEELEELRQPHGTGTPPLLRVSRGETFSCLPYPP
eukprot:6968564-Prymnesium_polylepis.1